MVFDTVGKTSVGRTRRSLKAKGSYLLVTFGLPMLAQMLWFSKLGAQKMEFGTLKEKTEDLVFLKDLFETGVIKPVVDRCYPLEQAA